MKTELDFFIVQIEYTDYYNNHFFIGKKNAEDLFNNAKNCWNVALYKAKVNAVGEVVTDGDYLKIREN